MVEQMYVQYFLPKNRKGKLPLLMWHGGGLTGVTYETTPDGREGWLNMFIRKGWDVYNSGRGRARALRLCAARCVAGRADLPDLSGPVRALPHRRGRGLVERRSGQAARPIPGTQFPVEAYDNYMQQTVPRWLSTDDAIIAAYVALVDKVCPA